MLDQTKLQNIQTQMTQKKAKQKGASMIEYAIVIAAVVALSVVFFGSNGSGGTIGTAISSKMTNVASNIQ